MSVCADHQRAVDAAGAKELLRHPERVDESGAHRLHVERRTLSGPQPCLQTTGGRRIDAVGSRGAHHDEVQPGGVDAGRVEGVARRAFGEVRGRLRLVDDVAPSDAGAFPDPHVAGIDLCGELGVGDDAFRKTRSGSGDSRIDHTASFSTSTDAMRSLMRSGTFFLISATASMIARLKATTSALP